MKYSVNVNEKSKVITVTLPDGTTGTAKCCDTDNFNLTTGIELALERAKVAKANKEKPTTPTTVMELVKALEKALPKGQMVVVGNADRLTDAHKRYLATLAGVSHCTAKDCDGVYSQGYEDGYADGCADTLAECDCDCEDCECECEDETDIDAEMLGYLICKALGIIED